MVLKRPKIIVTGGAGYIGSHTVVELWAAGYDPVVVDNFERSHPEIMNRINRISGNSTVVHQVDCRDRKALANVFRSAGDIQAVIHFAAYKAVGESVLHPSIYYDNNIGGLAVLLEVMAQHGNPGMVFSSSCTVYGQPKELPVTESSPVVPALSPYGYTKQVCEQLLKDCAMAKTRLKSVSLRYFNPIGAHPSASLGELPIGTPNNLVPYLTQAMAGLRPPLTVFGQDYPTDDGTCVRDYIHVVDLAKAHVAALQHLEGMENPSMEIFNIGSGKGHSVLELINAMEKVTEIPVPFEMGPRRPGDVAAIWASSNKHLPTWSPKLSLEDALLDAWNWQKSLSQHPLDGHA
jgi:UDP-glucose 4-epimerase